MINIHLIVDYKRVFLFLCKKKKKKALTEMNESMSFPPKFQSYITNHSGGKSSLVSIEYCQLMRSTL